MKLGKVRTKQRKMMLIYVCIIYIMMLGVFGKLVYIMVVKGEYYSQKALDVQERERRIKAARGKILDRNNNVIASNKTVCTVSVIHRQIRDTDAVIKMLCEELDLEEKEVRKKVEKVSVREKIKSNVDKEIGDKIRSYDFDGVKVESVNTINRLGKVKRQGRTEGRRPSTKKAYITLTKDSKTIEAFDNMAQ